MKFTAGSDALLDALKTAARARPRSTTMAILQGVLFTREGPNGVSVRCTNLEQHVRALCSVEQDIDHDGPTSAVLPYHRLADTLAALNGERIQIVVGEDYGVRIDAGQGTYEMRAMDAEDFPDVPEMGANTTEVDLDGELAQAIEETSFAVDTQGLRPAMGGMLLQPDGTESVAVGTDGHQLAKVALDLSLGPQDEDLIIPEEALSIMGGMDGDLLFITGETVALQAAEGTVYTRTIDEQYPNYDAVFPDGESDVLEVAREELLGAVRRASIYAQQTTQQIRLQVRPNSISVEASDRQASSESEETIPAEYDGAELEIGFSAEYLENALSVPSSPRVRFELGGPSRTAVLLPEGREDLTLLLMPVLIN